MSPAGAFWLGAFVFALIEAGGFGFVHFFQRENRKCAAPPLPPPCAPPVSWPLRSGAPGGCGGGTLVPPSPALRSCLAGYWGAGVEGGGA